MSLVISHVNCQCRFYGDVDIPFSQRNQVKRVVLSCRYQFSLAMSIPSMMHCLLKVQLMTMRPASSIWLTVAWLVSQQLLGFQSLISCFWEWDQMDMWRLSFLATLWSGRMKSGLPSLRTHQNRLQRELPLLSLLSTHLLTLHLWCVVLVKLVQCMLHWGMVEIPSRCLFRWFHQKGRWFGFWTKMQPPSYKLCAYRL